MGEDALVQNYIFRQLVLHNLLTPDMVTWKARATIFEEEKDPDDDLFD